MTGRLTVLAGPSGVGKGTVVRALLEHHPEVWVSVSATTRAPRAGEVDGVDYLFWSAERFAEAIRAGDMLEWADFAGNRYGTPRAQVEERLAAGVPVLLEIEVQGARQVRQSSPGALLVFLAPPSWEELQRRLEGRGTEDPVRMARRLEAARGEMAAEGEFDAVIINDDVETACRALIDCMNLVPPSKGP